MRKEQMYDLGNILVDEINKLLAHELELLLDNEVIKPEFHNSIVARIKQLRGKK